MNDIRINRLVPTPALALIPSGLRHRTLPLAWAMAGLALVGSACSGGGADSQPVPQEQRLGQVEAVTISESVGPDGSTETVSVTFGQPAELALSPVAIDVELVSPTELEPSDTCLRFATPEPVEDSVRGIGRQDGVELAYFVTEYADDEAANDAMSGSSMCYLDYAADLSVERGFAPSVSPHEQLQFFDRRDAGPYEFRIQVQHFEEEGPAIYSARVGATVATVIDLDNQLDEFDAESLSLQLVEVGA